MKIELTNPQRQIIFHSVEEKLIELECMPNFTRKHGEMEDELKKIVEPSPYHPNKPKKVTINLSAPFVKTYLRREAKDFLKYLKSTIKEVEKIGRKNTTEYWWDEKNEYKIYARSLELLLKKLS